MGSRKELISFDDIFIHLARKEKVKNNKLDWSTDWGEEYVDYNPNFEAVEKAKERIKHNDLSISNSEQQVEKYLDEVERLRNSIKEHKKDNILCNRVILYYDIIQSINRKEG